MMPAPGDNQSMNQTVSPATSVIAARPLIGPHARPPAPSDAATKPGEIHTETLPNGVRLIIAERPGAASTSFQLGVGSGSLQDPAGKLGLAHMLEHLAFEGSPTRTAPVQEAARAAFGGDWNAYTTQDRIVFTGSVPARDAKAGAALLTDMFANPATSGKRVPQERAAVQNEMTYHGGALKDEAYDIAQRLMFGDTPGTNNVIGTRASTSAITTKDLKEYHARHFVGRNTVALVDGDPRHLALDVLRRELGKLPSGERVDNTAVRADPVPGRALQIINDPSSSTVALDVLVPIPAHVAGLVDAPTRSLVTSAISSRLNDRLRRNGHMTYGASAKLMPGDGATSGTWMLNVSTNVDAPNAKQALRDIVDTLHDARDGFGPKTFERDRASLAAALSTRERGDAATTSERASIGFDLTLGDEGFVVPSAADLVDADPKAAARAARALPRDLYQAVSSAFTRLDDMKVLAIGAIKDGGDDLLAAITESKAPEAPVARNPVDLRQYKEMGIAVPRQRTMRSSPAS